MSSKTKATWTQRLQSVFRHRHISPDTGEARTTEPPPPFAAIPTDTEWDEAYLRVESYLRAHQVTGRVRLNQFTTEILTAARVVAAENPAEHPATLAIQVAQARIGEWLMQALGEGDWTDERFRARGRLALLMADIPRRYPEYFLSDRPLPPAVRDQLVQAQLYSGPELRVTGMPPAPLEFTLTDTAAEKWVTFSRSTFFRATKSWFLIGGILGFVWFATR